MAQRPVKVRFDSDDRVSGVIDRINKRLAQMHAPVERTRQSLSRFADLSGLNKIGGGLQRVGHYAESSFASIGRIVPVLGTLTSAASIAGVVKLATAWASFGSTLGFNAQRIGLQASALQGLQGAARLAGSSASSLTSGLETLQQGMFAAAGGRDPQLVSAFHAIGVQFQDVHGRALSAAEVLPKLAEKIAAIRDPAGQAAVATAFFSGSAEDLLPLLRLSSNGIARLTERARHYGVISDEGVEGANRLRVAQTDLSLSVEGFGNTLAQAVEPALTPVIHQMAEWVNQGRLWVAANLPHYISEFQDWCKRTWPEVDHVAQSLGGWKHIADEAAIGLGGLFGVSVITGLGRLGKALFGVATPLELIRKTLPIMNAIALWQDAHAGRAPTATDLKNNPEMFAGLSDAQRAKIAATPPHGDPSWMPQWFERFNNRLNAGGLLSGAYHRLTGETRLLNPNSALSDTINAASGLQGVDPAKVRALITAESGGRMIRSFDPKSSAFGFMQLTNATAQDEGVDSHDPAQNILGGTTHFARAMAATGNNFAAAVAAYHDGLNSQGLAYFRTHPGDLSHFSRGALAESKQVQANYGLESAAGLPAATGPRATVPSGTAANGNFQSMLHDLRLSLEINHRHVAHGTTARIVGASPGVRVSAVRTQRAMDPELTAGGV